MTIDSPVYQFSYNSGFGANGSPKKPKFQSAYSDGWVHTVGTLQGFGTEPARRIRNEHRSSSS